MKIILLILVALSTSVVFGADKRFKVKNEVTGLEFVIEDGREKLGEIQPEWGKDQREVDCEQVPAEEMTRILSRRTAPTEDEAKEFCTLKKQYSVVEVDTSSEKATAEAKRLSRINEFNSKIKALDGKSLTAADMKVFNEWLIKQLLDPESDLAMALLKYRAQTQQ